MSNLAKVSGNLRIESVEDLQKLSNVLASSGFFEDAKSAAQCFVKVLAGQELGFPAFSAMTGIHIVKGKPSVGANLMAARIKSSGKYDYVVKTLNSDLCEIEFFQGTKSLGVSSFSKEEAQAAGTQNMQKFPRNMLFARAISNGVRFFCPDIFLGAPVYTPEELGAQVNEDGNVIDVSALAPPTPARDWSAIKSWSGFESATIASIANRLGLPTRPSQQSAEQSDQLRDAVYADWAIQTYPGVFNALLHAMNALAKLKASESIDDDESLWLAWVDECNARLAQKSEPIPALD